MNKPRGHKNSGTKQPGTGLHGTGQAGAGQRGPGSGQRSAGKKSVSSPREVALDILTRVEEDRSYSNLLLHRSLERLSLSRADVGLTTELVYGTIQRLNTIDHYLGRFVKGGLDKLQPWVRNLLRLSFYQLSYLDRIPPHAAVSEAVNIAKKRGHQGISGMVNGVLRNVLRQKDQLTPPPNLPAAEQIALAQSHPLWLAKRYVERFGPTRAEAILAANNTPPHTSARVNRVKLAPEELSDKLITAGLSVRPSPLAPAGLLIEGGGNLALTPWYTEGLMSVQDESSMLVAETVAPIAGMTVLDCCAAPGGKTAHLAELMGDKGRVVACDVFEHKEQLITAQAKRLGLTSIETVLADARELHTRYPAASFDRILLDAPCSGLGVIRRKPELKWYKEEADIPSVATLQKELLGAVHGLLKPGGILVYSTCTTEPEENAEQIHAFLVEHPTFELLPFPETLVASWNTLEAEGVSDGAVDPLATSPSADRRTELREQAARGMLQLLPDDYGSDGFFIARLGKKAEPMVK
jgi:16S rRNA (cytosine967-C5)-methyltransferase